MQIYLILFLEVHYFLDITGVYYKTLLDIQYLFLAVNIII